MGVVHNSVYYIWFENGRTEWMRKHDLTYKACEEKGWFLPVIESGCRYLNSAGYDDLVEIETSFIPEKGATFRFDYTVRLLPDKKILAEGFTRHVCIDSERRINRETTRYLKKLLNK
jgi:acyl-CoA thioester hydrolase